MKQRFSKTAALLGLAFFASLALGWQLGPAPAGAQGTAAGVPVRCSWINRNGNAGNGATNLAAAYPQRSYLMVHNPSTAALQGIAVAESVFIDFGANAALGGTSLEIAPGGTFVFEGTTVSNQALSVISTTNSHKVVAREC